MGSPPLMFRRLEEPSTRSVVLECNMIEELRVFQFEGASTPLVRCSSVQDHEAGLSPS
jgi:hypothetical protein